MMDHHPSNGYSSPPPAYNDAYDDGQDDAAAAHAAWEQDAWAKEPGGPPSNDGIIIPGHLSGGVDPYYPGPPNLPWAVPRGPTDGIPAGQPLRAGYIPPSGLLPAYAPPPHYMGLVPAPTAYAQQPVVIIGRQQAPVQIHAIESFCGHIALACFVFWFCNILLGAIAFTLAGK
jgi:hypothetical protein